MCYEHSPSEGLAPVQLLEDTLKKVDMMPPVDEGLSQGHLPAPERLEWIIDSDIQRRITVAANAIDK